MYSFVLYLKNIGGEKNETDDDLAEGENMGRLILKLLMRWIWRFNG